MSDEHPLLEATSFGEDRLIPRKKSERLLSLDVLRGVTIALMIFVDFCGESTPAIDHSPWNGIKLADFVMPSFDFIVGVSLMKSMQGGRMQEKTKFQQLYIAFMRSLKLFMLGMATQAGTPFPTYDLKHIRIMGILQRVSLCYLVAAISEIYLPRTVSKNIKSMAAHEIGGDLSLHGNVAYQRRWHWLVAAMLVLVHSCIIYGVDDGCGRGIVSPKCNGASFVDRHVLGTNHMYFPTNGGSWEDKEMTFQRTHDCSSCSPGRCVPPPNAPNWCGYASLKGGHAFDPEGLVSSLTAVVASIFGAHCGAAAVLISDHTQRLIHWGSIGLSSSILGVVLHFLGLKLNTDIYSVSYLLLSTGVAALALCLCYYVVDYTPGNRSSSSAAIVPKVPMFLQPFQWLGLNSIFIYLLSVTGITETFLTLIYWDNPDNNLSHFFFPTGRWWGLDTSSSYVPETTHFPSSKSVQICCWCLFFYIPFWMAVAGYLHGIKWYMKI